MTSPASHPRPGQNRTIQSRVLRRDEVCKMVGLSRSTLYRLMGEQRFPQSFQLGLQSVGWELADVQSWITSRKSSSVAAGPAQ